MLLIDHITSTAVWSLSLMTFSIIIGWIGIRYTEAEVPRASNEKLLHNLKEGVMIFDVVNVHL